MKRGFLIIMLSAVVGGLTAYFVVKNVMHENTQSLHNQTDAGMFRTVSLSHDKWPDFTYAAETAVDAVVYVKVMSTKTIQQGPGSIFDYFFHEAPAWKKECYCFSQTARQSFLTEHKQ